MTDPVSEVELSVGVFRHAIIKLKRRGTVPVVLIAALGQICADVTEDDPAVSEHILSLISMLEEIRQVRMASTVLDKARSKIDDSQLH